MAIALGELECVELRFDVLVNGDKFPFESLCWKQVMNDFSMFVNQREIKQILTVIFKVIFF